MVNKYKNIPKHSATLEEVINFYRNSDAYRRLSSSSQKDYDNHLSATLITEVEGKMLRAYRCKNLKVRHITQAYNNWLLVGTRTANYRRSVLSAAWKHIMRHDVFVHNPIALVQTVTEEPRRVYWDKEQVHKFLSVAYAENNWRWRSIGLIVHMAYDWGQRMGDMRLLTWNSLDLNHCRVDMTQSKRNAEVHLPMSNALCDMLRQQHEDFSYQEYVVPRTLPKAGAYTPYTKQEISLHINKILDEANLPKELTGMDLRRTAVKEMMEGGADVIDMMQVTGHKNVASLKPYMVNTFSGASKALAKRGVKHGVRKED
jgi:site-specific recombinase XerD